MAPRSELELHVKSCATLRPRGGATAKGFSDVLLAGLAEDGGLFLPAVWPKIDAAAIAGFAGRAYADVAVEILRPSRRSTRTLIAEPRSGSVHAKPMRAASTRRWRTRCVRARAGIVGAGTVPRPDSGVQRHRDAVAVAAHGPGAKGARAADHHRRGNIRRHRRGRHRGVPRQRQHRCLHPLSGRPRLADPAPADDHRRRGQRSCGRRPGHVRRLRCRSSKCCSAKPRSATEPGWPGSTPSTSPASSGRSSTTSRLHRRWARRPARSPSPCRPATLATSSPATPPSAWGCRSNGWSLPPTSTTS